MRSAVGPLWALVVVGCGASSHLGDDDDLSPDGDADSDLPGDDRDGGDAKTPTGIDASVPPDGDPCCDLVGDPIVETRIEKRGPAIMADAV